MRLTPLTTRGGHGLLSLSAGFAALAGALVLSPARLAPPASSGWPAAVSISSSVLDAAPPRTDVGRLAELVIDYPLDGSVFPPDMVAPTFLWHDESDAERWRVEIRFDGQAAPESVLVPGAPPQMGEIDPRCVSDTNELPAFTEYQASARTWEPPHELWERIKRGSVEQAATLTFHGLGADDEASPLSIGRLSLTTSRDPVGAPIFYRDVPLMPARNEDGKIKPLAKEAVPLINWRLRDVSRSDSRVMLTDMPTCANCHSFSEDGSTMGMDVDGPSGDKGAYALAALEQEVVIDDEQVLTWSSFEDKPEGHKTLGFLSRVSPDGRFVVSTVNEELFVVNYRNHRFIQVFYPTRGILAYHSRDTGEMKALPGADDPEYVHCDPVWTPDGESLVFARARARDPYVEGRPLPPHAGHELETRIQYDLYRIPFNDGAGGVPERIVGASENGVSNTFPKVSPDGKWIVLTRCQNGQLMRPDGRLWILPLEGGEAREMRCNTPLMNSWHSFSPNSRWMVFSSKSRSPYTQMFLTHIDEDGNDSPAILIEGSTAANRAVNLPEFVNVAFEDFTGIRVPAVDYYRHYITGKKLAKDGRHAEAAAEFELALAGDWEDSRIHDTLSESLMRLGRTELALKHMRESVRIDPEDPMMQANLGVILLRAGELEEALVHLDEAIRRAPNRRRPWLPRGTVRLLLGDAAGALSDHDEAIRLGPKNADAYGGRGFLHKNAGNLDAALSDFNSAIRLAPREPGSWYGRAQVRFAQGDLGGAMTDVSKTLELAPRGWPQLGEARAFRKRLESRLGRTGG